MAKKDQVAESLAQLKLLSGHPRSDAAIEALTNAIASKSNLIVTKAAEIIDKARLDQFIPQLISAFDRFMPEGKSADPGCAAKTAIAKALYELEARAEPVFLRGIHHIQMEGVWGGSTDTAAELRGLCALGLVRCNARDVLDELAELLVDHQASARLMAARAIAYSENDAGAPLLRMKILSGDESPDVLAECCAALLRLTPRKAVECLNRFADPNMNDLFEITLMALGESRLPAAFDLLKDHFNNQLIGQKKIPWLLPIAMTRLAQAVEFLIRLIDTEHVSVAAAAIEALMKIHHADENLKIRIKTRVESRNEDELRRVFENATGSSRQ